MVSVFAISAFSNWGNINPVHADTTGSTELTPLTFSDFKLEDGTQITGWTAKGGKTGVNFENVSFNGYLTFTGEVDRYVLVGNGWNGLTFLFKKTSIVVNASGIGAGSGVSWTVSAPEGTSFQDRKMQFGFILEKNGNDAIFRVSVDGAPVLLGGQESRVLTDTYKEGSTANTNLNNIAIYFSGATTACPIVVDSYKEVEKVEEMTALTFSDFKLEDGMKITGWKGNTGKEGVTFENISFKGYLTFSGEKERYLLVGDAWNGMWFVFNKTSIQVNATSVGAGSGGKWTIEASEGETFQDRKLEFGFSLEKSGNDSVLKVSVDGNPVTLGGMESRTLTDAYQKDSQAYNNLNTNVIYFAQATTDYPIIVESYNADIELTSRSFNDFNLEDGVEIVGWTAKGGKTGVNFEDVLFNGYLTFKGEADRYMLAGNGWNGLIFLFKKNSIDVNAEGIGGGKWTITASEGETFQDKKLQFGFSLRKKNQTDAVLKVYLDGAVVTLGGQESQTLTDTYLEGSTENINISNVAIYFSGATVDCPIIVSTSGEDAPPPEAVVVPDLTPITLKQLGMMD